MPDQRAYCDACGLLRESREAIWYTVHFGISDPSLMIHASDTDIRRLGEHHACSRECLHQLVIRWADEWLPKKKEASA
jgi:hypothetical protein